MRKYIAAATLATLALFIYIPSSGQHLLGVFSGTALRVDTQIETPAQNNMKKTLPAQEAGNTVRFQLFAPAGAGAATHGYTVELDLPGRTFSDYVSSLSGTDWGGRTLTGSGVGKLSALIVAGATVPATGYLGQIECRLSRALEDGATLIIRSMAITSGRDVDQLNVSDAVISFTGASPCPGDFDNNGSVDLADFLAFAAVFGTTSSDADFDSRMDLDGNGSVDLGDFLALAAVFGTPCPDPPPPPPPVDLPDVGAPFRDCDTCPTMVRVPVGSFIMGAPAGEIYRYSNHQNEIPQHPVTIDYDLAVGVYEVTRGQFAAFVEETGYETSDVCYTLEGGWAFNRGRSWRNPGFLQDDNHPVVCVNWEDAQAYALWLRSKTGRPYRLLSESEWEYVARAGTTTPFHFGETISHDRANFYRDDTPYTSPAGSYGANAFGLYDVHGNVWEYVQDCWNDDYIGAPDDGSAWRFGNCQLVVLRGGSWAIGPTPYIGPLRSASRTNWPRSPLVEQGSSIDQTRGSEKGFRVARNLSDRTPAPRPPDPPPPPPVDGDFRISLVFIDESEFTAHDKNAVISAARRWEEIITTDLPDVDYTNNAWIWYDPLLEAETAISDAVDDVRIFVRAFGSDASYSAAAGPRLVRANSRLPISGAIHFNRLSSDDYFGVALHEIGHVLGIGTLWDRHNLDMIVNPSEIDPAADTHFRGALAIAAFDRSGGINYAAGRKVPVQNNGDDGHWRESVFVNELMSPYYTPGVHQPLSAVTVQALADLGYRVDGAQADAYQLPGYAGKPLAGSRHYGDCIASGSIFIVDEHGEIVNTVHGEEK